MSIKQIEEGISGSQGFNQDEDFAKEGKISTQQGQDSEDIDVPEGFDRSETNELDQEESKEQDTQIDSDSGDNLVNELTSPSEVVTLEDLKNNSDIEEDNLAERLENLDANQIDSAFDEIGGIDENLENSIENAFASGDIHQFENLKERIERLSGEIDSESLEKVESLQAEVQSLQEDMKMISDKIIDAAGEGNLQDSLGSNASQDEIDDLRSEIEEIREDIANLSDFVVENST